MAVWMRINDALELFPEINPAFFLPRKPDCVEGRDNGRPDFVSGKQSDPHGWRCWNEECREGDGSGSVWGDFFFLGINHHCDKALQ